MLCVLKLELLFILFVCCTITGVFSANLDNFTEKERIASNKLKERLKNELYKDYMKTDHFLVPWIRDRNYNLEAAQEKILKSLRWRKEKNIDNIVNNPAFIRFNSQLPHSIIGRDELGSPFAEWKVGPSWIIRRNVIAGKSKQLNEHFHHMMETIAADLRNVRKESGLNVSQAYLVPDMAGYNLREHGCLACIPFFLHGVQTYENNYVNLFKYILVVNAPKVFENLAQLLRAAMSPGTKDAFKVFSVADKPEVKRLIASTNPKFISRAYA